MTSYPLQSLEELSDLETSSAIGHCIDDDEEFIRNARARTMVDVDAERMIKGGKRVAFLWYALRHLPDSLRKCVFLDLLQGSDDGEDIWLWNEGDEALLEWVVYLEEEDQPPPWTSAAAALERRLTRTPPRTLRRREVESAAFKMRAAMIGWLALTSAAYKSAYEERGVRDCEEWDMRGWIQVWYWGLPWRMLEWLDQCSKWYDHRAFTGAMDQAGHSCHQEIEKEVRWWLFMRSQLFPTQQDTIIHFRSEHCAPCLAHKPTCGCEPPPSWTPSLALVALRDMWDDIESHYDERRDFSQWLLGQPIYGMKEANEFLRSLPRDTDEDWYLSWINTYPRRLRRTVTQYTLAEWRDMDDCLTGSAHGGSLNIRSWWAAMHWRMMPPGLSHSAHVKQFIDAWRYSVDWRLEFLPLQSPAPEFRDAIRESGHTCWEESQMDNYAAAMAVLKEDPKVVGSCVREYSGCQVCELQWRLQEWGETLPVEEQAFSEDLTELLVMLRTECSRRKVAWDDILTSAQKEFINTDFSDFSEEAEISDAGSDVDEASGEDKRAPVAVIHPSQVNTAGHGENNPSSGLVQTEKVVDVEEESADAVRRPNFTNLPSENPHLYSIGPVNFGEAIIHGRQIHNSQQINALSTNSGGSHSGSDPSFGHIPDVSLQPSALDSIQNWPPNSSTNPQTYIGYQGGTLAPWNQGLPEGGSDPTVGRQQGYIGISASNSVEKASVGQNGGLGDFVPTEASAVTYPTGNPARRQVPSTIDIVQDVGFTSRNTPPINSQSHASSVAAVGLALPSKRQMADEIKKHLTDEMVRVGISLPQTGQGQVKLPWLYFETTLAKNRVRMINWPAGVARPGKDLGTDTSKGIKGVTLDPLTKIYRAIYHPTAPIQLLRDETVLPNGLYTMSGETSVSRKRPRDSGDDEHETSPPERGGKRMYFGS